MTEKISTRILHSAKSHLNIILTVYYFSYSVMFACLASLLCVFILFFFGYGRAASFIWPAAFITGALAGIIKTLTKQISLDVAGRWLDKYLNTNEAFSALLFSMSRDFSGFGDQSIADRAESICNENPIINWPYGRLLKPVILALLILLISGFTSGYMLPRLRLQSGQKIFFKDKESVSYSPVSADRRLKKALSISPESSKSIAHLLFPKDEKLAEEAEKALSGGDYKSIEKMLNDSSVQMKNRLKNSKGPEAEEAETEMKKQEQVSEMIYERLKINGKEQFPGQDSNGNNNPLNSGKTNDSEANSMNFKGKQNNGENAGNRMVYDESAPTGNNGKMGNLNITDSNSANKANNTLENFLKIIDKNKKMNEGREGRPGSGIADDKGNWKYYDTRTKRDKFIIKNRADGSQMLEYINPDKKIRVPLSQILPDFKKAAENAIRHEDIPAEYEDFVGSYFLELSKELK